MSPHSLIYYNNCQFPLLWQRIELHGNWDRTKIKIRVGKRSLQCNLKIKHRDFFLWGRQSKEHTWGYSPVPPVSIRLFAYGKRNWSCPHICHRRFWLLWLHMQHACFRLAHRDHFKKNGLSVTCSTNIISLKKRSFIAKYKHPLKINTWQLREFLKCRMPVQIGSSIWENWLVYIPSAEWYWWQTIDMCSALHTSVLWKIEHKIKMSK